MQELNPLIKSIVEIDDEKLASLHRYYEILITESEKYNLTSIKEIKDVYIKHYYDSLLLSKVVDLTKELTLADIGSGAGFPGLVLKIVFPNLKITLIEPTSKRCNFLNYVINELNLKDIKVINDRAENYIINVRETFDIATARAVAPLNILLELAVPFLKVNGLFIALKGSNALEELETSKKACKELAVQVKKQETFELPEESGKRIILTFKKTKSTKNIYPRLYSKIKKQPL